MPEGTEKDEKAKESAILIIRPPSKPPVNSSNVSSKVVKRVQKWSKKGQKELILDPKVPYFSQNDAFLSLSLGFCPESGCFQGGSGTDFKKN